jgi:hypothetical protein
LIFEGKNMKENKILAYCGIDCGACPAYVATQNDDDALRAETARKWTELYKAERKVADINCDGSGRLFAYCGACEVRRCAREHGVATCAVCPEYSCARLDEFCALMPTARELLEGLRKR